MTVRIQDDREFPSSRPLLSRLCDKWGNTRYLIWYHRFYTQNIGSISTRLVLLSPLVLGCIAIHRKLHLPVCFESVHSLPDDITSPRSRQAEWRFALAPSFASFLISLLQRQRMWRTKLHPQQQILRLDCKLLRSCITWLRVYGKSRQVRLSTFFHSLCRTWFSGQKFLTWKRSENFGQLLEWISSLPGAEISRVTVKEALGRGYGVYATAQVTPDVSLLLLFGDITTVVSTV